jgi:hypothetical protein
MHSAKLILRGRLLNLGGPVRSLHLCCPIYGPATKRRRPQSVARSRAPPPLPPKRSVHVLLPRQNTPCARFTLLTAPVPLTVANRGCHTPPPLSQVEAVTCGHWCTTVGRKPAKIGKLETGKEEVVGNCAGAHSLPRCANELRMGEDIVIRSHARWPTSPASVPAPHRRALNRALWLHGAGS